MYGFEFGLINKMSKCLECQNCVTCQKYGIAQSNNVKCNVNAPQEYKIGEITLWNTRRCNLNCEYCFVYELHKDKQTSSDISDEVIQALPNFVSKYCKSNPSIWFFGGEPLVNFDGIKKIYDAVGTGVKYGMTSNLTLMTEDKAKWLGQRNFGVLASIDGNKDSYNSHRKFSDGTGAYDLAIRGLKNARLFITKNLQIRYTVTPVTVKYVYDSVRELAEMGYDNIALEPVYEVEWNVRNLDEYSEQLKLIADMMIDMPQPIKIKPIMDMAMMFNKMDWKKRCGLAQFGVGMDTDGVLYPCHRFVTRHDESLSIGNVFDGPDMSKIKQFNNQYIKPVSELGIEKCIKCVWKEACIGSCLACNLDMTGNISTVPESVCKITEMYVNTFIPKYLSLVMKNRR